MSDAPDKRRGCGLGYWCFVTLFVLAGYVGTYYALVEKQYAGHLWHFGWNTRTDIAVYSANRTANKWLSWGLRPIHEIDKRMRPGHWQEVWFEAKQWYDR